MQNQTYRTKNLQLASFLAASKLQLVGAATESGVVYFEFVPRKRAQDLVADYFSGRATVDPRELFARLNDLRDLIFSGS